jgi:hypothetical protein
MNNDYIFIPKLDLNLTLIKEIVFRNLNLKIEGMATHQRKIEDESYLLKIQEQYPFLSNLYNIYNTKWDYVTPVHIDSHRNCALNIPIFNVNDSYTVFYQTDKNLSSDFILDRAYYSIDSEKTEIFKFSLNVPTIINTKIPHSVSHNNTKNNRIIMSWSINNNYSFNDVKKILMSVL